MIYINFSPVTLLYVHPYDISFVGYLNFDQATAIKGGVIMAKTNKGKKVVPVKPHTRKVGGKKVRVKPHKRSTPN